MSRRIRWFGDRGKPVPISEIGKGKPRRSTKPKLKPEEQPGTMWDAFRSGDTADSSVPPSKSKD